MNRRELIKAATVAMATCSLPATAAPRPGRSAATQELLPWTHAEETLRLSIVRQPAVGPAVLYVHGATFPTALSVGWRMDGMSWLDQLQAAGMDAWAFDFAGYGGSDRPEVFEHESSSANPFGRFDVSADQIAAVLRRIRYLRPHAPINVIAHSWGTLAARQVAIDHPDLVSRLVLFGPVVERNEENAENSPQPAWTLITSEMQRPRQRSGMPDHLPTPVTDAELERWIAAYLDSDPTSALRAPRAVKVPNGPSADLAALWSGQALVDNSRIRQPTLILRGEWDHISTDSDAARLFASLTGTADKRDVKIAGGNHWLHLQPRRRALWAETISFLREGEPT